MFKSLRNEILARMVDVTRFCKGTCSPDGERLAAVGKGLSFVHMYSVYEYCVRGIVQSGIAAVNSHSIHHCDIRDELLSLALDSEIASVMEAKHGAHWRSRVALFRKCFSASPIAANDSVLPAPSEHFHYAHLKIIWATFGLTAPILPYPRLIGFVDELVDKRNAVSHGRITAYDIGRAFTAADIDQRVVFTQDMCLYLVQEMETHCLDVEKVRR
jgi:hypothetical protein